MRALNFKVLLIFKYSAMYCQKDGSTNSTSGSTDTEPVFKDKQE